MNDYKSRNPGCVTEMLTSLKLDSLQDRRTYNRLVMLYKVAGGMVPAVDPDAYLTRKTKGRLVKPKKFSDCVTTNIIRETTIAHTDQFKNSFL